MIIDECHRSGYGRWKKILEYFKSAVHFGMTATLELDDNIDTYAYFGTPVYVYSLGQGIEDGFLAPYRIHKIYMNIDKKGGLFLNNVASDGADLERQKEIADYLDKIYEKIKSIKEKVQFQANQLDEMKESILNEVFNHDKSN